MLELTNLLILICQGLEFEILTSITHFQNFIQQTLQIKL